MLRTQDKKSSYWVRSTTAHIVGTHVYTDKALPHVAADVEKKKKVTKTNRSFVYLEVSVKRWCVRFGLKKVPHSSLTGTEGLSESTLAGAPNLE